MLDRPVKPGDDGGESEAQRWHDQREPILSLHRRSLADTAEPGGDVGIGSVERLADLTAEIEKAIKQDVGEREALAAEVVAAVGHLAVQPLQAIGRDLLQSRRCLGRDRNPLLEEFEGLAETI